MRALDIIIGGFGSAITQLKGTNLAWMKGGSEAIFYSVMLDPGRGEFEKEKLPQYVWLLLWYIINIKIKRGLN